MAKTKSELESMTKDELIDYADDHDIEVHHSWLKDEIISAIMKGEKATAKEEAKHEQAQMQAQPIAPSGAKAADQQSGKSDPSVEVDPDVAAAQELANAPQDQSTLFAAKDPPVVKKDD